MKVCDLDLNEVKIGLRLQSLKNPEKLGSVVRIDYADDQYAWIRWDGEEDVHSGFYGNDCQCEVIS